MRSNWMHRWFWTRCRPGCRCWNRPTTRPTTATRPARQRCTAIPLSLTPSMARSCWSAAAAARRSSAALRVVLRTAGRSNSVWQTASCSRRATAPGSASLQKARTTPSSWSPGEARGPVGARCPTADFSTQTATIAVDAVPPGLEPLIVGSPQDGPFTYNVGERVRHGDSTTVYLSAVRADPRLSALWGFWADDPSGTMVRGPARFRRRHGRHRARPRRPWLGLGGGRHGPVGHHLRGLRRVG